jgi:hypothetical protein
MSIYTNQFKKSPIVGQLDLTTNPTPSIMTVRYDPTATSTLTMLPGEGVILTDLGANDSNSSGVPLVTKRTNNYDAVYGIKVFNIKKNANSPAETFDVARAGAVMFFQCKAAILRGAKVSLVIASEGEVQTVTTAYNPIGIALDKGSTNDIIRVELIEANTAVSST